MAGHSGSSVPRRQLGRALRRLRTETRMTLEGAADEVRFSRQKLWRIEAGREAVRGPDVRTLCGTYAAPVELTGALVPLAAGPHHGAVSGGFVLLDYPAGYRSEPDPSVVYRESLTGALHLDQAHEVAAYEQAWASLDALALTEDESQELIGDPSPPCRTR